MSCYEAKFAGVLQPSSEIQTCQAPLSLDIFSTTVIAQPELVG